MLYTKRVTLVFLFQFICTLAFVVYCLLIVINFAEMFHTSLTAIHRKRSNDSWLQARCKEQEFVHHIRHHIDLCETVERDALANAYLIAMQMALDGLHLCGSYSCEKILISLTNSLKFSIYTWIASFTIVLVLIPLCVLPLYRKWQRNLLLYENQLGENAIVPSVYIRDRDYKDDVYNMHALSNSYIHTDARQRRCIGNVNNNGTGNNVIDNSYSGINSFANQSRYPLHDHAL